MLPSFRQLAHHATTIASLPRIVHLAQDPHLAPLDAHDAGRKASHVSLLALEFASVFHVLEGAEWAVAFCVSVLAVIRRSFDVDVRSAFDDVLSRLRKGEQRRTMLLVQVHCLKEWSACVGETEVGLLLPVASRALDDLLKGLAKDSHLNADSRIVESGLFPVIKTLQVIQTCAMHAIFDGLDEAEFVKTTAMLTKLLRTSYLKNLDADRVEQSVVSLLAAQALYHIFTRWIELVDGVPPLPMETFAVLQELLMDSTQRWKGNLRTHCVAKQILRTIALRMSLGNANFANILAERLDRTSLCCGASGIGNEKNVLRRDGNGNMDRIETHLDRILLRHHPRDCGGMLEDGFLCVLNLCRQQKQLSFETR